MVINAVPCYGTLRLLYLDVYTAMKLQQLNYLIAIADNNLSITSAAAKIHTSQPGISKQLRLLEDELQTKIFERNGKLLTGLTKTGEEVLNRARKVLQEVENIRRLTYGYYRLAFW